MGSLNVRGKIRSLELKSFQKLQGPDETLSLQWRNGERLTKKEVEIMLTAHGPPERLAIGRNRGST